MTDRTGPGRLPPEGHGYAGADAADGHPRGGWLRLGRGSGRQPHPSSGRWHHPRTAWRGRARTVRPGGRRGHDGAGCDVLLLTARFGNGHRQVALAVEEALRQADPTLRVGMADYAEVLGPVFYRSLLSAYAFSLRYWWAAFDWFYRTTARLAPGSRSHRWVHGIGQRRMLAILRRRQPRVAVCTFPEQAGMLSELRRRRAWSAPTLVVVTDNAVHSQWIHPYADFYCVPSAEVAAGLMAAGVRPERVAVTGIPLRAAFARRYDRHAVLSSLGLDPALPTVLITGGPFGDVRPAVVACRTLLSLPEAPQVILLSGEAGAARRAARLLGIPPLPGAPASSRDGPSAGHPCAPAPDRRALPAEPVSPHAALPSPTGPESAPWPLAGSTPRLVVLGWVPSLAPLLHAADILVGKAGGVTTAEALACGLPLVLYRPLPGQERANANFLASHGAARVAEDPLALATSVGELLRTPQTRLALQRAALRLGRPRAAQAVAQVVLGMLAGRIGPYLEQQHPSPPRLFPRDVGVED